MIDNFRKIFGDALFHFMGIVSFILASYKLCLYIRKTKLIILTRITGNRNFVDRFPALCIVDSVSCGAAGCVSWIVIFGHGFMSSWLT